MNGRRSSTLARRRLAYRILLRIGGPLLVVALAVAAVTFVQVRSRTLKALEQQGSAVAETFQFALEALLDERANPSLQRAVENSSTIANVRAVRLVDHDAIVRASSDRLEIGRPSPSPEVFDFLQRADWRSAICRTDGDLILVHPLYSGRLIRTAGQGAGGAIQITMDRRSVEADAFADAVRLLAIVVGSYLLLSAILVVELRTLVVRPLDKLAEVARRFRGGDRSQRSRLVAQDEIGQLSAAFDEMAEEIESVMAKLEEQVAARTEALDGLTEAMRALEASAAERLRLGETIRELSTPVIRVYDGVVVMPLIGQVDSARAQQIEASLLDGVVKHEARKVILDLTGVAVMDKAVAAAMFRAKRAAQLLGAEVIIVGISSRSAQSIVDLGLDFSEAGALADLKSGVLHALRGLGFEVKRSARRA